MAIILPPTSHVTPRRIVLDGPLNARDLGGLPLLGGGATRFGVVLRSDAPTLLSERDVVLLTSLGVRSVIDLRTDEERRRFGVSRLADAPVDHLHVPLLDGNLDPTAWTDEQGLFALYRYLLDHAGDRIVQVLRLLAMPSGATVIHCTAGKDRTGVVAAATLLLVGTRRASVVADYVATESFLPAMRMRYADLDGAHQIPGALFAAPAWAMEAIIDHLDDRYGGALAWARAHGWTDADQHALVDRFTDPDATPLAAEW
jgi:protein-tyrosine phosphatase